MGRGSRARLGYTHPMTSARRLVLVAVAAWASIACGKLLALDDVGYAAADGASDALMNQTGDAEPDGYCTGATFCDGFERADLTGDAWNPPAGLFGADSMAITSAQHHFGERSVRATVSPLTRGAISKTFDLAREIKLSFFLFVPPVIRPANLTELVFSYLDRTETLFLTIADGVMQLSEEELRVDASTLVSFARTPLSQNAFVHIEIDVVLEGVANVTLKVDDVLIESKKASFPYGRIAPSARVGVTYVLPDSSADYVIYIDDVRVDIVR